MENEKAIEILANIRVQYLSEKKYEEANALFLGMRYLASKTSRPYIKCDTCSKWYRRSIEEQVYNNRLDLYEYYCYCPYCGEEYSWNEGYWR